MEPVSFDIPTTPNTEGNLGRLWAEIEPLLRENVFIYVKFVIPSRNKRGRDPPQIRNLSTHSHLQPLKLFLNNRIPSAPNARFHISISLSKTCPIKVRRCLLHSMGMSDWKLLLKQASILLLYHTSRTIADAWWQSSTCWPKLFFYTSFHILYI